MLFSATSGAQSLSAGESPTQDNEAATERDYISDLERIKVLVRANVLTLAEELLETQAPPVSTDKIWRNWQKQLWTIYRVQGKWQKLYESTQAIPSDISSRFQREAKIEGLDALLAMGQGRDARKILREDLLSLEFDERFKLTLRQKLVESYLVDNMLDDARISMEVFQSDYRSQEPEWLLLSARINIQTGNPDQAVNLLAPLQSPEAKLLQIYARLQNESITPNSAIDAVLDFQSKNQDSRLEKPSLAVLIASYQKSGKLYPTVNVLEEYVTYQGVSHESLNKAFPEFGISDLLSAYENVALDQGNKNGLLIGQELEWLEYANSVKLNATITRRSLYAYIVQNAERDTIGQLARDAYINVLIDIGRTSLVKQLFTGDLNLGELSLSGAVGLRLSNYALEIGDIQLAADANENLLTLPPGMDRREWLVHSARIAVIAGRYRQGAQYLGEWINGFDKLDPEQTDQVLQPVFDLQTVNQHSLALPLLETINRKSSGDRHRREIAYWIAESYFGTGEFLRAADFFLFSAMQKENGFDQWGESARFKAAESLTEAGMLDDAKSLFEGLLRRAADENRKLALKQKLQQIWLQESNKTSLESATLQTN